MSIAKSAFAHITLEQDQLIICGGGHVSIPILTIGKMLGFYVTVIEDRPLYADHARAAGADEVICDSFHKALQTVNDNSLAYYVVVTRGHRYDVECLRIILQKDSAYVGMMGSRLRSAEVRRTLLAEGHPEETVNRLHSPIGIPIGGETPEEIAVSILAEVVQVRSAQKKQSVRKEVDGLTPEILQALLSKDSMRRCLAIITSRKGSAPRSIGTRMVVFEDGTCVGTIGGGCIEAEVVREALHMIRESLQEKKDLEICMLPEQAEEEGMVCGGIIGITLENIDLDH